MRAVRTAPTRDTAPRGLPHRVFAPLYRGLRLILEDKVALTSLSVLLLIGGAAILAPWLALHSPSQVQLADRLLPPAGWGGDWKHVLGTDPLGRDVLSRILFATRNSLLIGASVVLISGLFGSLLGLIAGYKGGWLDSVIMRLVDAQLAFPGLLLVIVVVGVLGPSPPTIIVVLSVYGWMIFARLVRGNVLQLREQLYVRAATMMGSGSRYIMRHHLLPNLVSPLLTQSMLELARVMLVEASLSYLGLGIQPPNVSLGLMVAENQIYLREGWWTVLFPGLTLAVIILSINLVTTWIRIRSDPQQRLILRHRRLLKSR